MITKQNPMFTPDVAVLPSLMWAAAQVIGTAHRSTMRPKFPLLFVVTPGETHLLLGKSVPLNNLVSVHAFMCFHARTACQPEDLNVWLG